MAETSTEFELSPEQASELEDAQLVDVRTSAEYDAGHAEGAVHVSLDELQAAAGGLDRDRPVVFYCRAGERSRMAVDAFRASGWDAYGLEGGLLAWAERGLPLEPQGAEVAPFSSIPTA
ncbi:MAG TPA: rhodanese-like domain-containing protein [Thermoleophilaceae bacterium]